MLLSSQEEISYILPSSNPQYNLVHLLEATKLPVMAGRLQSFAFFLILLSFFGLGILGGMSRPLNTVVLHRDADQKPKSTILKPSNMVVRSPIVEGHRQKNIIRKLVIDQSGPSPQGGGHDSPLSHYQLNN